tara:strand:+ start:529 stop:672 length:144 start_codon:yes stop_codon:yes gene_type:complete
MVAILAYEGLYVQILLDIPILTKVGGQSLSHSRRIKHPLGTESVEDQ